MLLERREQLTLADHQTHRRYTFEVPPGCVELRIEVHYSPKFLSARESAELVQRAVTAQVHVLTQRVGRDLAENWARVFDGAELIVPNLVTIAVDDANGAYRGAGHRHDQDQALLIGLEEASPGLVPGPLPHGEWALTATAHTVVSALELQIQIGAVTASS